MSFEDQITNEPIEGCTCGTCIWKLREDGIGKYLQTNCAGGTNAVWMVKYDSEAFQITPLTEKVSDIFNIKINYDVESLDISKDI